LKQTGLWKHASSLSTGIWSREISAMVSPQNPARNAFLIIIFYYLFSSKNSSTRCGPDRDLFAHFSALRGPSPRTRHLFIFDCGASGSADAGVFLSRKGSGPTDPSDKPLSFKSDESWRASLLRDCLGQTIGVTRGEQSHVKVRASIREERTTILKTGPSVANLPQFCQRSLKAIA